MKIDAPLSAIVSFCILSAVFAAGFAVLAVRLKEEQIDNAAEHRRRMSSQSFRRVRTAGLRGRILDRHGKVLAENALSLSIVVNPESFKRGSKGSSAAQRLWKALEEASAVIGRAPSIGPEDVEKHFKRELSRPMAVWRGITGDELARFSEHQHLLPGFECVSGAERRYPCGRTACHLVGRTGRDRIPAGPGGGRIDFIDKELCGREGVELQYDEYLRGMPGEEMLLVDARGFTSRRTTVVEPGNGPDLVLTIDLDLQRAAEAELDGLRGACVAIDPRDGAVRALASAPGYDLNECVPVFRSETYRKLASDPDQPLLNRATAGTYAPGSTYKTITALAGMRAGHDPSETRYCDGAYELGSMRIRCARTWGHGELDMVHAMKESCNPYFCALGVAAGTNALCSVSRMFGLGSRTGIDFPTDAPGVVPDAEWKAAHRGGRWRTGDLAQMSIGQGMLLATPLQMARVAAAIGTGRIATPRLNAALPPDVRPLGIGARNLETVRRGMRLVVDGGTGRRGGEGVDAYVIGKTGTAQVGFGDAKRKNTWFIAYAEPTGTSKTRESLAVALVVENGESGGSTAAPKVASVLREFFNKGDGS